jgi:hypothetical protein
MFRTLTAFLFRDLLPSSSIPSFSRQRRLWDQLVLHPPSDQFALVQPPAVA